MLSPLLVLCATLVVPSELKQLEHTPFSTHIASKIVAPIFIGLDETASGVVRIERVAKELQRKGFFRVALLQSISLHSVHVEIRNPKAVIQVIDELPRLLTRLVKSKSLDVNHFRLSCPKNEVELNAAKLIFESSTTVLLHDVHLAHAANSYDCSRAILHIAGEKAGVITLAMPLNSTELHLFPMETQ